MDQIFPIQREYVFLPEAGSTSERLKEEAIASSRPLFRVLSAARQTAGRGRQGRSFFSPAGGIYFSASFPFPETPPRLSAFSLLAGLAVYGTLAPYAPGLLRIKWPNDLLLNGRKVCGMLAQTVYKENAPTVILGVGINADAAISDFPPALRESAASFASEGLSVPPAEATVREAVSRLDALIYEENALWGDLSPYLDSVWEKSSLRDARVSRVLPGGTVSGTAVGLSPDGGLLLRTDDGEIEEITFGEVN